jgi:DNA-binding CsgD family transcriptional regulator
VSTQQREGETPAGYQGTAVQAPDMHDATWLRQRYVTEGQSLSQIAAELGCSRQAVHLWLRQHGIPARHQTPFACAPTLTDRSWLAARYVGEGHTTSEIAAELGCSVSTVRAALRAHGIPRRGAVPGPARAHALPVPIVWPTPTGCNGATSRRGCRARRLPQTWGVAP